MNGLSNLSFYSAFYIIYNLFVFYLNIIYLSYRLGHEIMSTVNTYFGFIIKI